MTKAKAKPVAPRGAVKTPGTPAKASTPRPAVGTGPAPGITPEQGVPPNARIGKNTVSSRPVTPGNSGTQPRGSRTIARPRVQEPEGEPRDLGPMIRVQATAVGFVDNARRREGDVFDVHEAEFSDRWMVRVTEDTPERITGPAAALRKIHDDAMPGKLAKTAAAKIEAGDTDPLGSKA